MAVSLQQLPWNILALIVHNLQNSNQLRYARSDIICEKWSNQFAFFLYTCQSWRTLILENFCYNLQISIDCSPSSIRMEYSQWPSNVQTPICNNQYKHMVKIIMLELDFSSILNGRFRQLFDADEIQSDQLVFPMAHTLDIVFGHYELTHDDKNSTATDELNIFMRIIKQLAPRLKAVNIKHCMSYTIGNGVFYEAFKTFIDQLSNYPSLALSVDDGQKIKNITVEKNNIVKPLFSFAPRLTSMDFVWNIYYPQIAQLLHRSASSLQSLTLMLNRLDGLSYLVQDEYENPIVYPNLNELHLSCWYYLRPAAKIYTRSIPFPKLKQLYLHMDYPFSDDTIFRGNCNTLECLYMNLNTNTINMADKYQIFRKGQYNNLKTVCLKNINSCQLNPGTSSQKFSDFAISLPSSITTLIIEDVTMKNEFVCNLFSQPSLVNLQLLSIPDAFLTITDIIGMLRLLPCLNELRCVYKGLGDDGLEKMTGENLTNHFASQYPINRHFRVLQLGHWGNTDLEITAQCSLLLAIACPSFTFMSLSGHARTKVNSTYKRLINTKPYSKYADRLILLLDKSTESIF
ncbi:hypothetical protein COEREDRAFT_87708 [Coemansia reversa NRRL 1564]|uniref:F-box domain-containing protein n=1 Tax=Coemansia reversa (strain ATCC 12441 / NRRL 1564) TaxID=763665 RepID=A0A2G5B924_COERN|nr:hypothetical protein COEREDRAFT_87708 [Coemansia reversa NRRL 1564]|eukprot:PIA15516.1 hypothetical protein COEREDRAFT_87708 [Coemansia reversa NRRL 1564]